ncbi:MAG: hypothetical protein RIG88_13225 [Roseitalea porphyridii]
MNYRDFAYGNEFEEFFEIVTPDCTFDVINLPPQLWRNIYLLDIRPDRSLIVRLAGDAIQSVFDRNLKGVDLRQVTHGAGSKTVTDAYDAAIDDFKSRLMRRRVHLRAKNITRIIECGFVPLVHDGGVHQIVGCFMAETAIMDHPDYGCDDFVIYSL